MAKLTEKLSLLLRVSTALAIVMAPVPSFAVLQNRKVVDGWGPWRFGQNLEQALAQPSEIKWNSYSLQQCRDRMEIDGCLLGSFEGPTLPPIDAIKLRPTLRFDKHGYLIEILLGYERESKITPTQCLDIFGRLVDWQAYELGNFRSENKPISKSDIAAGWSYIDAVTSNGTQYRYGKSDRDKAFVTSFVYWDGVPPSDRSTVGVSVFSSFITVDGVPHCHVSISYKGQKSGGL